MRLKDQPRSYYIMLLGNSIKLEGLLYKLKRLCHSHNNFDQVPNPPATLYHYIQYIEFELQYDSFYFFIFLLSFPKIIQWNDYSH